MNKNWLLGLGSAVLISACSGSSSTSGGGSTSDTISGQTYTGQGTVRVSGDGIDETATENVTITVNDSQVRVQVDEFSNTGSLNGNRFSVPISIEESFNGYDCEGTLVFNGIVNGNNIRGNLSGGNDCDLLGATIIRTDNSGTFSATAN